MLRAAICPYYAGYLGYVVADGRRVVRARSFAVGHLEALAAPDGRHDARRIVDASDVAAALAQLGDAIAGVEAVAIEWQGTAVRKDATGEAMAAGRDLATALRDLCERNSVPVTMVGSGWRARRPHVGMLAMIGAAFDTWPPDADYRVCHAAGALLLVAGGAAVPKMHSEKKGGLPHAPRCETAAPAAVERAGEQSTNGPPGAREDIPPQKPRAPAAESLSAADRTLPMFGDAIAGLDPGSAYCAIVIGRGIKPLALVHRETIEVGELVQLAKPRTVTRKDGTTYEVTTRRSFTGEHVDATVERVVALLREHRVAHLGIEHNVTGYLPEGAGAARQTELNRALWLGAEIRRAALSIGVRVTQIAAVSWRARVAGRSAGGGGGKERVPAAVAAGFADWPWSSNDHERDAAGVCLALLDDEVTAPKARAPRERKPPRPRRRKSNAAAKRAALGCTCGVHRGRHPATCPAAPPRKLRGLPAPAPTTGDRPA